MIVGYFVEVDTTAGTKYVGEAGRFSDVPVFWKSDYRLLNLFSRLKSSSNKDRFSSARDAYKTSIIEVSNLEKGVRTSSAKILQFHDFFSRVEEKLKKSREKRAPKPNRLFRIRLAANQRFVGAGKFGKIWSRESDLRKHLTSNLWKFNGMYKDAKIVETSFSDDFTTIISTKEFTILEFYTRNKKCAERICTSFSHLDLDALSKISELV